MSYRFEFDPVNRILRVGFEGLVTDQILTEFYDRAGEYVARTLPRAAIIDFSAVTSFAIVSSTMFILAKFAPIMEDHEVIRVIIAPRQEVFGIARMFQIVGEDTRPSLLIVRSQEEAYAKLGIQGPRFEPVSLK